MSTDTQNGSHLTVIDTPEKLRAELDRIEGLIRSEQAEILQRIEADRVMTKLADPEDDEPQPETDIAALNRWKVGAVVWLSILSIATAGAIGYRISQEGIPDVPQIFSTTQVGSVCDNCEG